MGIVDKERTMKIRLAFWLVLATLLGGCQTTPMEQQMVVRGTTLPYRMHGSEGPPVVMVHGCCVDQRSWAPHLGAVAQGRRIVTFDQRYYGTGPWPDKGEKFSAETQIEDLAAFVRGLGVGPVHLVAWSMSGASVLGVAVRYPELVRSLFIYEPAVASIITDPAEQKAAAENRGTLFGPVVPLVKAGDHAAALRRMMDGIDGRPGTYDTLPADFRAMQFDNGRTLPLMFAAPPPPPISCEQLGRVKAPSAIVRGEQTQLFYRIAGEAAARCLGHAGATVVPGARHLLPAQDPQTFAATLRRWLDAH